MNANAYALIGLTAVVAALVAVLAYAVLRFAAAARDARRNVREGRMESVLLSSALEDAIRRLKAQERAASTRAEASERLSAQIVARAHFNSERQRRETLKQCRFRPERWNRLDATIANTSELRG